ncbi:hypothetical protein BLNAU_9679 [Blattamonas nauphoetae]|uniref:Uncharacterized protein n=1 Tax=Blattamonas nauphoetae TaxID=2049346 RepID=A0ABQ9XUX4_9EUKA|nr:hypothetical protein BLNAU_9679 [Blattamonas nauphoetae]
MASVTVHPCMFFMTLFRDTCGVNDDDGNDTEYDENSLEFPTIDIFQNFELFSRNNFYKMDEHSIFPFASPILSPVSTPSPSPPPDPKPHVRAPKMIFAIKYMIFPNGLCLTMNQGTSYLKVFRRHSSLNIQVKTAITAEPNDPELHLPLYLCGVELNATRWSVDIRNQTSFSETIVTCSEIEFTPLNTERELGKYNKGQVLVKFEGCLFQQNHQSLMKEIARQTQMDSFENNPQHFWLVIIITPNKLAELQAVCDRITTPVD